jgi:leader peptidase (prepilin peptidase) / N-methyltransferase
MNLAWAAAGALAGLPAGAMLRGPVVRLSVPSGKAARTACPHCGAVLVGWGLAGWGLAGWGLPGWTAARCRGCGGRLTVPLVLELATAAVLALLCARFAGQPSVLAFGFLGALGVALGAVDVAVHRLPDRLTLPAYPVLVVLLGAAAAIGHDGGALVRALLASVALTACYLLLAVLRPGQLGGGDIKLAGPLGLGLGWLGWQAVLAGTVLAFAATAVASLALLAVRRIGLRDAICFGPFMLGGALLAILATGLAGS